jgi:hypothetical protein
MSPYDPKRTLRALFDHLVGDGKHPRRNIDAERFGGTKIEHELEFGRLQHWQVGGLRALEDVAGIDVDLTKRVSEVCSAAHQPAACDKITVRISRWSRVDAAPAVSASGPGKNQLAGQI